MKKIATILIFLLCFQAFAQCWQKVASGTDQNFAIKPDGTLWGWGRNTFGQLGIGLNSGPRTTPVQIGTGSNWKAVQTGGNFTVALKNDGTIWSCGVNGIGQLGLGLPNTTNRNTLTQIGTDSNWVSISARWEHTCAVKTDGTLWGWGANSQYQLGDGTSTSRNEPVQIGSATNWQQVSVGDSHTIALKSDGTLWAWGSNFLHTLGDGTTIDRSTPTQIGADTDWIAVMSGSGHSFAKKGDGTIWGWGNNMYGQLGDGTTQHNIPALIFAAGIWENIYPGEASTIGIKPDGTLWAWGANSHGQLGDGTTSIRTTPVQIGTDSDWNTAASTDYNTVAIRGGNLNTWGINTYAQLGNGTTTESHSPVSLTCYSSLYNPTLNQSSWNITVAGFMGAQDYVLSAVGTVTIDGQDYTEFADPYTNQNYLLREVNAARKVYLRVNDTDQLWYDFNLQTGDEFTLANGLTYTATVDWIAVNGGMRKRISLVNPFAPTETWIEGVGSSRHPFLRNYTMPSDPYVYLTCSAQHNVNIYNYSIANGLPASDCSMLKTVDFKNVEMTNLYPNPADESLNLLSTKTIDEVTMTDMLGNTVLSIKPNASSAKIALGAFAKGIYIVNITAGNKAETKKLIIK